MKLLDRIVALIGQEGALDRAEPGVRKIAEAFENLESVGRLAKLVDELGDDVGLAKSWMRSEVLKTLEGVDPTFDVTSEEYLGRS